MPKIIDYPRASLANSLELADAVSSLGGSSTVAMAAERLNRKQGGAFTALISAASKYGLISSKNGRLTVQDSYRNYKLAYTDNERRDALHAALLSPPMFAAIYERFKGNTLPVEHFEKLLIREFEVPDDQASKVSNYFLEGAEQAGLLEGGNKLIARNHDESSGGAAELDNSELNGRESPIAGAQPTGQASAMLPNDFAITFKGPGLNSTIVVAEEEDLEIVAVMLKKVRKALIARKDEQ